MRAPLNVILPSIIPVALENGVSGNMVAPVIAPYESKLSEDEIRPILAAATYLDALNYGHVQAESAVNFAPNTQWCASAGRTRSR